jgi:hypothetical protein
MAKKVPGALWVSIAVLGAITVIQMLIGVQKGSGVLLVAVLLNVALLAGLFLGQRWAYVATLILAIAGLGVALGKGPASAIGVLVGNGLVVVPMVLSTRFFFPAKEKVTAARFE